MPNEELQRRSRRVRIFWIVAAAVVVIAIALSMVPDAVEADLAKADRGDVRVEVVDEGRTRMHDIYVVSAPITGRVLRVEVEPGDAMAASARRGCDVCELRFESERITHRPRQISWQQLQEAGIEDSRAPGAR